MSGRSKLVYLWLATLCVALMAACIRKRPPAEPSEPMAQVQPPSVPLEAPTGNYGKVSGVSLVPAPGTEAFVPQGKTERAKVTIVPVQGQPFERALRAEVLEKSQNAWDVQVQTRVEQPVEAGDVMLATFYLKAERSKVESGEAQTEFVMEQASPPWHKSVSQPVRAGQEWQKVFVRFKAGRSHAAGASQLIFRLGFEPQTILIGGVTVENFGKQLVLADLPTTKITYPGMEADAAWRAEAAKRIDEHRKQALTITVLDSAGKAVPGARVEVRQTRQAFGFGSAVVAQKLTQPGNERYKQLTQELFNTAVLENNLKWAPLAGDWGGGWTVEVAQQGVAWLAERNIPTRGHVLVWPSFRNMPRAMKALEKQPEKLRTAVNQHVKELATAMRGKLSHWDVLNEPFDNHDLMDLLGKDVMIDWFKIARAADPNAKLFINDYAILSGGPGDTGHREHYEQTIRFLLDKGAPLDGIGMQGHFGNALTGPEDLLRLLDRYAKLGKQIWVTEFDVDVEDENLAAQFTRDFYTTLFSHPAVGGIMMWGFWDGAHWHKNAPLYRQDWSMKPAGQAYRDLVLRDFRSQEVAQTDAAGQLARRVFRGDYELLVTHGGKTKRQRLSLGAAPQSFSVRLD